MAFGIPQDEFGRWLPPMTVRERVVATGTPQESAERAILQRVHHGLVRVASTSMSHQESGRLSRDTTPTLVDVDLWRGFQAKHSDFWAGDATFAFNRRNTRVIGGAQTVMTTHLGMRLDPADLRREFSEANWDGVPTPPTATAAQADHEAAEADVAKATPISDALMAEWAVLFRKTYPAGSEEMAAKSADGMFQGHSVPRRKLRDALAKVGKLPPGRPTKP